MDIQDIIDSPENQLSLFASILKRINASSDHDEILVNIISEIKSFMITDSIILFLIDPELSDLHYEMSIGPLGGKFYGSIIDNEESLAIRASSTISSLYSNEPKEDSVFRPIKNILGKELKNIMFMPLRAKKKNIGALFLINKKNSKFSEADSKMMKLFAELTSIALTNKVIYDRAQSRAYEVGALYQMSISINKFNTIEEVLNENISVICEAFESHRVSVILKENGVFKFKAGIGIDEDVLKNGVVTIEDNALSEILRTGKGVYSVDVNRDKRFKPNKSLRYKSSSFLSAPIFVKDEIIGFISATERSINKAFRLSDLALLEMLAQQMGENYMHVILYEESKIKEALAAEINITANLQQSILPTSFPNAEKFDISATSIPSKDVGGDFYDFIKIDEDKYAIIIADVSGKGLAAGLFMTMTRSMLRVYFSQEHNPSKILEKVNRHIYQDSKTGMFVTCFLVVVDTKKKSITYSNAGHLVQYFVKAGKKTKSSIKELHTPGKPLGFVENAKYKNKITPYESEDTIILCTDGITETFNSTEEEYGEEKLKKIFSKNYNTAKELNEAIVTDTVTFRGDTAQFDDITLLVARLL